MSKVVAEEFEHRDTETQRREERELPKGWGNIVLYRIARLSSGVGFPVEYQGFKNKAIPFYKVSDISFAVINNNGHLVDSNNTIDDDTAKKLHGDILPVGATVFAKIGEALRLNRRGFIIKPGVVDNNVIGIIPGKLINNRYSYFFLKTIDLSDYSQSTAVPSVRKSDLENILVPLPPLPEQERIAARLDVLLGRLKAARGHLDAMPESIKRFRKSVLAQAVSGKLTEEWRAEHAAELPSAEELLATIRRERRAAWEKAELEKLRAKGKEPRDEGWKMKYVEPAVVDGSEFGELPAGWVWIDAESGLLNVQYGTSNKSHDEGAYPVIRMGNIQNGRIDWHNLAFSSNTKDVESLMLKKGDVLFNRTNSPDLVGKAAVFDGSRRAIFAGYLIRLETNRNILSPQYFNYHIGSPSGKEYCRQVKSDGVSQSNINAEKVRNMPVPLPSLPEQAEIVRRVDELFAYADALDRRVADARKMADRLEPAILAKAFRGELSEQRPEEAAAWAETLARLEAETAGMAKVGKREKRAPVAEAAEAVAEYVPRKRGRPRKKG